MDYFDTGNHQRMIGPPGVIETYRADTHSGQPLHDDPTPVTCRRTVSHGAVVLDVFERVHRGGLAFACWMKRPLIISCLRPSLTVALSLACACASSLPTAEGPAATNQGEVAARDHTSLPPVEVVVTRLDGVTIHTVVAPEQVVAVTSHVLETSAHLVVIDTQLTTQHSAELRALCERLQKPIAKVIVTHGHPDHYFGLVAFDGVPSAAFPEVRRAIDERHKGHQSLHKTMEGPLIPDVIATPTEDLAVGELRVDDLVLRIERVSDAEDVVQAILWLPAQRALIAQDLVSNGYHAFFGTGPVQPWLGELERLQKLAPSIVFAGHGPPGDASLLSTTVRYLERASQLAAAANSREELTESVVKAFPALKGPFLVEVSALIIFRDRARAAR